MKMLTLNTHSLQEEGYPQKLEQFCETVAKIQPDVIALQEVNQSINAAPAGRELLQGYVPCPEETVPVRQDNHAAQAAFRLNRAGITCSWTWVSAKIGYGKYDEGIALFCLNHEIAAAESFFLSSCQSYGNWKTRKALGIQRKYSKDWFFTVHMGWWEDEEEPFSSQWERLGTSLSPKRETSRIWLMGDFNSPAERRGEGYDCIKNSGWQDTYLLAGQKDSGVTVEGSIDGWKSSDGHTAAPGGMRMDHIWCSKKTLVKSSKVWFNGIDGPKVSDHYGVLVETGDEG